MEELKEKLKELDDYFLIELFKSEIDERFKNNQYEIGFDPKRHTEAFLVTVKLLLDSW